MEIGKTLPDEEVRKTERQATATDSAESSASLIRTVITEQNRIMILNLTMNASPFSESAHGPEATTPWHYRLL